MKPEQDKTLEGLQTAIQMESEGKEFYLKASQQSGNEAGRKLLETLAAEEDIHRRKFEEIYEAIRNQQAWPKTDFRPDGGRGLRTIFAQATDKLGTGIKAAQSELDAVQTAMDMEGKTHDFYQAQSKHATYDAQRDFYEALAGQEREHQLILLDYYEYLKDPAGWFVSHEHPTLDGG
ncbi:MAG TPA: ferritin family protein [Dehalococcoidia bacterium]|nr:ferritin family protein [Dehalococcoidia bacterium]